MVGDFCPGLFAAAGDLLLRNEELVGRRIADALCEALEALEKAQLLDGLCGGLQSAGDVSSYRRAVAGIERHGLQAGELAQRFVSRLQPQVGPVVPVGGVRRPELPWRSQRIAADRDSPALARRHSKGQMVARMPRRGNNLDGLAAPFDLLPVRQGAVDSLDTLRNNEV